MEFKVWDLTIRSEACRKAFQILALPNPERNVWYKAGLRIDDWIIGIETPRGTMGYLPCEESSIAAESKFWDMFNDDIHEADGFWVERIRYNDSGEFSRKDIQVRYE